MKSHRLTLALCATFLTLSGHAYAEEAYVAPVTAYVKSNVATWINDPAVIKAVKDQDAKNAALQQPDIDKLDKQWRAEVEAPAKPLIDSVMAHPVSKFLKDKQTGSKGIITEIFVMDDKGLNVAQSEVTSDYWQGDEAKFQKSFGVGPDALFVDKPEKDESTQKLQVQASFTLKDETGKPIGAVTVGINIDDL